MADVTVDPKNSNPKELYGQGIRAFVLQDYDTAVLAFSKACELLTLEVENELHDSLGDVYLYYGKSLLELSRRESGPLGDGVLKNVEEESETEDVEEDVDGEEESKVEDAKVDGEKEVDGESSKVDDEKTEEVKEDSTKSDDAKIEEAKPEEDATKSDDKSEEQKNVEEKKEETKEEAGTSSDKKEGDNEDPSELQIAWEVLELAKSIFGTRGDDGKKNLAETHIILGEISLESGNFSSAIEDILKGLEIQKTIFENDSRTIAETYFKLGGAYSTNGQIEEAIQSFNSALEYLQNKISNLKKDEEHKEANTEEIEELENLIPEIQEKIADMKNFKVEIANKMNSAATDETVPKVNGNSEASSSKVNDISHLVKRKRKDDDGQEDNPAKRPSP